MLLRNSTFSILHSLLKDWKITPNTTFNLVLRKSSIKNPMPFKRLCPIK